MDSLQQTRSDSTKKINVRVIHVKPASDLWINDDSTGLKIAGRDELTVEKLTLRSSPKRTSPSEIKTKLYEGRSSTHTEVSEASPIVKQTVETNCLEVKEYDSDEDELGQIQLKQNEVHQRRSILKIPSDLSTSMLNLKTETNPSLTNVPPRSIQIRSYNQGSSSSIIGFDLNARNVLKEEKSGALVIRHSTSAARELASGQCPALELYFGNRGASCSNITPRTQSSPNQQLKPDAIFSVDRNKSWKTPKPLETKASGRGKKRKSKRKKIESKVNYTPVEKFVEPTDAEFKTGKETSKSVFKILS